MECEARLRTSKRVTAAQEIEAWYVKFCAECIRWNFQSKTSNNISVFHAHSCISLTLWETVPNVKPVILAVPFSHQQGVVLQVKGHEREGDVHVGRGDDHVGALQIVRIFIREARGLDHSGRAGEVAEAELRP